MTSGNWKAPTAGSTNCCPTSNNTKSTANRAPHPTPPARKPWPKSVPSCVPCPLAPGGPMVWSQPTRVCVGADAKVPVGPVRHRIDAPPRSLVIRCLRPAGDILYLRHAPDNETKPIVLLHCPVFCPIPISTAHSFPTSKTTRQSLRLCLTLRGFSP